MNEVSANKENIALSIFKDVLKNVLIECPPKRLSGMNSDWHFKIVERLMLAKQVRGSMQRCDCSELDGFCNDKPCYDPIFSLSELNNDLEKLINSLNI